MHVCINVQFYKYKNVSFLPGLCDLEAVADNHKFLLLGNDGSMVSCAVE